MVSDAFNATRSVRISLMTAVPSAACPSAARAGLEFVDHTIFEDITPLVFATLIDMRPDSKNHASHLVITKAEKAKLLQDLEDRFGTKMDDKTQNLTVSAATVLRGYLLKDWKCSDEPWE